MTGASSEMQLLVQVINGLASRMRSNEPQHEVAQLVQLQTERRFSSKTDADGVHWSAWSGNYARTRRASDSLLIDMSTHGHGPHLKDSIETEVTPDEIVVGSEVDYAGANQETRPFLGIGARDQTEIEARLIDVFSRWVS